MYKMPLEDLTRFLRHMPRNGDPELTLLKGHLLIEEMLQLLIEEKLANPAAMEDARLTFHQRLCLVRALYNDQLFGWVWTAIQKLNTVRNKLAHILEASEIQSQLEEFVTLVEREDGVPEAEILSPVFGRIHWALFKIHSTLSARLRFKPTMGRTLLGHASDTV
jgi:hypothetical protein